MWRNLLILFLCLPAYAGVLAPARGYVPPLEKGLVGWWLMNEGTGDKVLDLSGHGNTGTLQGDVTWSSGRVGSCLTFDGTGDYVSVSSSTALEVQTGAFSVAAWVKLGADNGDDERPFVAKGYTSTYSWILWLDDDDLKPRFSLYDGTNNPSANGNTTLSVGLWSHVAGVYTGSTLSVYHNGVLDVSASSGSYSGSATGLDVNIGAWPGQLATRSEHVGLTDDVRIYNRDLSASEVRELYLSPWKPKKGPSLRPDLEPGRREVIDPDRRSRF